MGLPDVKKRAAGAKQRAEGGMWRGITGRRRVEKEETDSAKQQGDGYNIKTSQRFPEGKGADEEQVEQGRGLQEDGVRGGRFFVRRDKCDQRCREGETDQKCSPRPSAPRRRYGDRKNDGCN